VTLTIQTAEDQQRQLAVTIEVAEDRVQKAMRDTARTLGREIEFPGFRKGKVPYQVLVRRIGHDALRAEAVEGMLTGVLEEAIEQMGVELYGQPTLDDMQMDPLVIKLTLPLEPIVKLGDYRSIRRDVSPIEVREEAINESLEHIRTHHELKEPVDRPAQIGDSISVSGKGQVIQEDGAGEVIFNEERLELLMEPEKTFAGTPFVENLVGASAGDEKEFSFTFPDTFEDESLAGQEAQFNLTVLEVQSRELPELNDELAKKEGQYETLDELKDTLRKELAQRLEDQGKTERMEEMMSNMLEGAELVYPPAAVHQELDGMIETLREQVTASGWKWEDYLKLQGKTVESLHDEFHERAEDRLRRSLILRHFIEQEKITIQADEIDAALQTRLDRFGEGEMRGYMAEYFLRGRGRELLLNEILVDKIQERMDAILTGNAPDLSALEEEAADSETTTDEEE
jgi:trigger factor